MLTPLLALVAVVAAALALFLGLRRRGNLSTLEARSLRADQNASREAAERSLQALTALVTSQMQGMQSGVQVSLAAVTSEVGNRLDAMNRNVAERLNDNSTAMRASSQDVNSQMAGVQSTFANLQKQVGEMTGHASQLTELSSSGTQPHT